MNDQQLENEQEKETNFFILIIQKYLPFWPLFALTIPVALVFSYVLLRAQTPIYVASAKVLLKDPNRGGGDSKVLDALNIFSEKKIVDNEIIVLRSSGIMKEIVKELDLYSSVFNEGKVREEALYGLNSPVKFRALDKDSFTGYGKYYFSIDWKNKVILIDNKNVPFDSTVSLGNVLYRLEVNPFYNQGVIGKK